MKKILAITVASIIAAGSITACSAEASNNEVSDEKISIVTTIFPEYDWVMNVLGDNPAGAEVTMLLDDGVDLHSYQPTVDDIMKIADCDLFIYVGGESDEWVEDALAEATNDDMIVINLLDVLGDSVVEEETVEGMEAEEEEGEEGEEEGPEYDEHVWLSLRNAKVLVESIEEALVTIDPDNESTYCQNADSYVAELTVLDEEYSAVVSQAACDTVLFGDRFPFRYMTDDYGLNYYAAFVGCSAETEASFETITFLANKVDERSLNAVLTIEGADHSIAETIVENTAAQDQQILTLDSMQSVTASDVEAGASYISIMESNLVVLREALS
ncbi:MAG: zinc ABC transporter substrate-binding protein [Clostridiales bacterium]|nr:zinc ABC transporter substrate-binding protein [Clostridiales bacterium]